MILLITVPFLVSNLTKLKMLLNLKKEFGADRHFPNGIARDTDPKSMIYS